MHSEASLPSLGAHDFRKMHMWELIGLVAIMLSIVAVTTLQTCRDAIKRQEKRVDYLGEKVVNLEKSLGIVPEKEAAPVPPETAGEGYPKAPEAVPIDAEATAVQAKTREGAVPFVTEESHLPSDTVTPVVSRINEEWWSKLEDAVGKRWITWVGALVLFLGAGLFVKYAFEHKWLGPTGRILIGVIGGICVAAAGEHFVRRQMRALGQGLIGAGLAILYVSLYAAYHFYQLLPQQVSFALMVVVTAGGLFLAVIHGAIAISFLAVLGGFLTPVMLSTGQDPRDALFSYLLLLDIGVLVIAWFKRWRALDVLAFIGTWVLFTGWYTQFHNAPTFSLSPTLLWLAAFYLVFLLQPFIYHLRLATPIVGERFILAVSNAMGMFGWTYTILHEEHKHVLGLITLGMSVSYFVLGSLTRKRIKTDERAVFGFIALSVALLTIAVPIHFDFHGVTIAWAVKAPLLLYLAYRYSYFPVRVGSLIPLALAVGRIFTIHWPLHEESFTPVLNGTFCTAMFVALAGATYTIVHQSQRKTSWPSDRVLKIATGIAAAFLALIIAHTEIWQWLDLSGREDFVRWAAAFVWAFGAGGFLAAGLKVRSMHSRVSGFAALAVAGILCIWDYGLGIQQNYLLIFNGRFFAGLAVILVVFSYAFAYLRSREICLPDEKRLSSAIYGVGILLLTVQMSFETWQWLALRGHSYIGRCVLSSLWVVGAAGYLGAGVRLRSTGLRKAGAAVLAIAVALAAAGYAYPIEDSYFLFFNGRFAATFVLFLMVFAYAFVVRRLKDICRPSEEYMSEALYGTAILLLVLFISVEMWLWLSVHDYHYLARCLLPLVWVGGAAGYLGAGVKLRTARLRIVGLGVLSVGGILATYGYTFGMDGSYLLYLNGRFLTALILILMVFADGFVLRCFQELCGQREQTTAKALYGIGIALLFILLNVEMYSYFSKSISDPEKAGWAIQMSLSILWGVYATALLVIGFWRRVRSLRLSALGLFGTTALKVVILDMAKVEEVYRIVSFLVLGALMICASYLYHRVEKRLSVSEIERE